MNAIVSLSGGLDSTTLLGVALEQTKVERAVAFEYPSKHNQYEVHAASRVARHYGIALQLIDLRAVFASFRSDLLLSGGPIPHGHYEQESMKKTVVPGRNTIFLAVLTGLAQSLGVGSIYIGAHAGDHYIYPDCRPKFLEYMALAIAEATEAAVTVAAPFTDMDKSQILRLALARKNVPLHLTRTCYANQAMACGRCGSCQERLWAFKECGAEDPLSYESRELLPKTATP